MTENKLKHEKYDVVIVGAGPGGLRCAEVLGVAGKKVLLVEKNNVIGPKICAGGLTRKAIMYLRDIGMQNDIIENQFDSIIFRIGKFKTRINFGETFLYTLKRQNLGQWQLQKLRDMKNVTVQIGATVTKIKNDHVIIDKKHKAQYDFLVGADGSASIVRKFLGIETKMFGVAFQYIVPSVKQHNDIEIVFDSRLFSAWYAWIFPYANSVSIGTGYFPKIMSAKRSMQNFDKWLKEEKIDIRDRPMEAHPINCDYKGYHFDNVFLIGDAAGVTSGFTGEGIYQTLILGDEVAQMIVHGHRSSKKISAVLREKHFHEFLLLLMIISGPLRNGVFYMIVLCVKIPWCGKMLLRGLS